MPSGGALDIVVAELQEFPRHLGLVDTNGEFHPEIYLYVVLALTLSSILTCGLLYLGRSNPGGRPLQRDLPIKALYIYPVKSMAAIQLDRAFFDPYGLVHDRRWIVVDE